jgi:hypothetical protein
VEVGIVRFSDLRPGDVIVWEWAAWVELVLDIQESKLVIVDLLDDRPRVSYVSQGYPFGDGVYTDKAVIFRAT